MDKVTLFPVSLSIQGSSVKVFDSETVEPLLSQDIIKTKASMQVRRMRIVRMVTPLMEGLQGCRLPL
ncbi:MAG: hypothetical protein KJ630_03700 [Proteobacteria bacterium]|nr:hypothetical protein [Pseudomonadota bacterium]